MFSNLSNFGKSIFSFLAVLGGAISMAFGGWNEGLSTLLIFMAIDYITGLIVAGVFKKSKKSQTGALESLAGWKGLIRKGMMLFIVLIACRLDIMANTTFVKDAVIIGFIANESLSIIENAGLMGVPIPQVIVKAIDVLKQKTEKESE